MKMLERYYDEITAGMDAERENIQSVNITAAADWFYVGSSQEEFDFRDDFPIVVPPFREMWTEYRYPNAINSNGKVSRGPQELNGVLFGCMSHCIELKQESWREAIERDLLMTVVEKWMKSAGIKSNPVNSDDRKRKNRAALDAGREARWLIFWNVFSTGTNGNGLVRHGTVCAYIDPNGQMVSENHFIVLGNDIAAKKKHDPTAVVMPVLFATSLMHAKNVSLVDDPLPAPIAKRRAREGKPVITFKTLSIEPMRKQSRSEAPGTSGAKRAMHIVRGHFKDYRDGGGLFGKMKGLYWWDMHVAGDAAVGTVVKDYKIGKVQP